MTLLKILSEVYICRKLCIKLIGMKRNLVNIIAVFVLGIDVKWCDKCIINLN